MLMVIVWGLVAAFVGLLAWEAVLICSSTGKRWLTTPTTPPAER